MNIIIVYIYTDFFAHSDINEKRPSLTYEN